MSLYERVLTEQTEPTADKVKRRMLKAKTMPTWWQIEKKLRAEGLITDDQALAFFCPVYFAGQKKVVALLDKVDEHGEKLMFSLPTITNPQRIEVGLRQMRRLGIKRPEKHLKRMRGGGLGLRTYSELPGIEGYEGGKAPEWVGFEAVQLAAFQIVPKRWLNAGDPYNQSYRFPGEDGYSPYWRIPTLREFTKMRPKLAADFDRKLFRKG